ncbi:MAG: hypothetical protein LBD06_07225 [Candidatus Accumulibacter sp.]|nr:hypothetical protein [Accumulibacter sp.]
MSLRRFAPFRGQKTERAGSEDSGLRGQKTGNSEDRGWRRQKTGKLAAPVGAGVERKTE